jgi:hypothetical protein
MKIARVFAVLACLFVLLEVGLGLEARRSKVKALQLLQTIDRFTLGVTSKTEVKSELRQIGLVPIDEPCSSFNGPCDGFGVELANYPESSQSAIIAVQDFVLARISVFRPTYLVANIHLHSDRFSEVTVEYSTGKTSIGTTLSSTDFHEDPTLEWRQNHRTGNWTFVRVLDHAHQQGASLNSADLFNLGCMESVLGCDSDSELWPSVSQYRTKQ